MLPTLYVNVLGVAEVGSCTNPCDSYGLSFETQPCFQRASHANQVKAQHIPLGQYNVILAVAKKIRLYCPIKRQQRQHLCY